jgi:hypothetical protein
MAITFQVCDFYNEPSSIWSNLFSLISALLGALISGLIAIWIFKKGLKKENEKKLNEHILESNELEQYFFHCVDSINFFIDKQVIEISKCSKRTKDWTNKNFMLFILPELTTRDIWEINQERLYEIFVTNRDGQIKSKADDFINTRNCLYNIDFFIKTQNDLNKEIYERLIYNVELWNQSLKILLNLSNSFVIEYKSDHENLNDSFLKFFNDIIVKKQRELINKNSPENIEIDFNELIVPLKEYIKNNTQADKRIIMITEPIMEIQKAYFEIQNLRYECRKNVIYSGRRLIKIKFLLNYSISNIKNREKLYKS